MCQVCAKVISASNNVFHSHPRKTTEVNRYISWRSPSPWTLVMFCGWSNRTFGMHSHGMLWVFQELPAVVPYMWVHGVSLEGLVPRWGELNRFIYDSDNVQNIVPYILGIISESELLSWAYLWQCREHHAIWSFDRLWNMRRGACKKVQSSAVTWNMNSSMPGRFRERIQWNRERLEWNWLIYIILWYVGLSENGVYPKIPQYSSFEWQHEGRREDFALPWETHLETIHILDIWACLNMGNNYMRKMPNL